MADVPINRSIKSKRKADLKVVLVGDAYVGKTCLVRRYMENTFEEDLQSSIGAAFFLKQYGSYNIAIWDTAGEEKFSGLSSFYCRNANAAIVAYDLTDPRSFESIDTRHSQLLESAADGCLICIVGTKKDLLATQERHVPRSLVLAKAEEMSQKWNSVRHPSNALPFFETSSKTGENVHQVFEFVFEALVPSIAGSLPSRTDQVELGSNSCEKGKSCCR